MDHEERLAARYERALALGAHTSPGLRVGVGDGQEIEVAHVLADAFQTLLFCRLHGGPAADAPHLGPPAVALDPPELLMGARSATRWRGFEVMHLPAVLPFRRTITLAFEPALPGDAPPELLQVRFRRQHEGPHANRLTVPVDPRRAAIHARAGPAGVVAGAADLRAEVLSFAAGITAMQAVVLTDPPWHEAVPVRRHHGTAPPDAPPGAPPELWRDAPPSGRPGQVYVVGSARGADRPPRRALPPEPWRATALPGGERLWPQGRSWGSGGPSVLTFDAPPPDAAGVRLRLEGAYRWEPVAALAEVPASAPDRQVPLAGAALAWPGGRLDLVGWEPGQTHHTLVARPSQRIGSDDWLAWLPELRLVVGAASRDLPCTPCDDGTFVVSLPAEDVRGPTVRLGVRAVGHRLPAVELDLRLDPPPSEPRQV